MFRYFYSGLSCTYRYVQTLLYNNLPDPIDSDSGSETENFSDIDTGYKYLVFSGGGIKGIAYCGALNILEKKHMLRNNDGSHKIVGFAGTSAGSIIAALLAVGYKPCEIKKIMKKMEMRDLVDDKVGILRDGIHLIGNYGTAPGNYVLDFMGELIEAKTGDKDYTIDQLYAKDGIKLVTVGTNVNMCASKYFYPNDGSGISIRKAVRISMSIPYLFEPVLHDGDYYVDGGMLDNFPLHVFDGEYPGDIRARSGLCAQNSRVLGLQILTDDGADEGGTLNKREDIDNLLQFSFALIKTFMVENDRRMLTPANQKRTVRIITPEYSTSNFAITKDDKKILMERGTTHCTNYFDSVHI